MSAETPVHSTIRSVNTPHHFPCICHFCKKNREYFLKRMQLAGGSCREAENFVVLVVRNSDDEVDFNEVLNVEVLRQWENLLK